MQDPEGVINLNCLLKCIKIIDTQCELLMLNMGLLVSNYKSE